MRIRTLKPEWMEDERMALASDAARVASVCLILLADDQGRGRFVPQMLASRIFAANPASFAAALGELSDMRFLLLYEVDGQRYWQIRNWDKHQRVDNAAKPRIPAPLDDVQDGLADFRGELPRLAAVRGLTPTPIPTPIPTQTPINTGAETTAADAAATTPNPRKPTGAKTKAANAAATALVNHFRSSLHTAHGIAPPSVISKHTLGSAKEILRQWPDEAYEFVGRYAAKRDAWLERWGWPLSSLVKYSDRYEQEFRNRGSSGEKSREQFLAEGERHQQALAERARRAGL